jgi:hypothetical protein
MRESAFVHAFLFALDTRAEFTKELNYKFIFDFDIYIGDSEDYTKNAFCGNYGSIETAGAEAWCNLQGKFIHMVKTGLSGNWFTVICTTVPFGTI